MLANTDLDVYSGDDGLTLPLMAAGAVGVVSVTAHVATAQYRPLVDARWPATSRPPAACTSNWTRCCAPS